MVRRRRGRWGVLLAGVCLAGSCLAGGMAPVSPATAQSAADSTRIPPATAPADSAGAAPVPPPGGGAVMTASPAPDSAAVPPAENVPPEPAGPPGPKVSVTVELEEAGTVQNLGTFVIELNETAAPLHAAHFLKLVDEGFYNGTTFHRIVPGFIIQGGDPLSRADWRSPRLGTGSETDTTLVPEGSLTHVRGAVAAARLDGETNPKACSNASQFFICLATLPALDAADYTVFGKVVEGMDVVERIVRVPNAGGSGGAAANRALHRVTMKNVLRVAP